MKYSLHWKSLHRLSQEPIAPRRVNPSEQIGREGRTNTAAWRGRRYKQINAMHRQPESCLPTTRSTHILKISANMSHVADHLYAELLQLCLRPQPRQKQEVRASNCSSAKQHFFLGHRANLRSLHAGSLISHLDPDCLRTGLIEQDTGAARANAYGEVRASEDRGSQVCRRARRTPARRIDKRRKGSYALRPGRCIDIPKRTLSMKTEKETAKHARCVWDPNRCTRLDPRLRYGRSP